MKPIDQIKNEIAHKNNFETWIGVLKAFDQGKLTYGELNDIVNQAMHRLAEIVAIEQRNLCSEDLPVGTPKLAVECILETALAPDEYKP